MSAAPEPRIIADRYRLEQKIGEGGMGEVYAARHVYIDKRVAVKLVRRDLVSDELARRFQQEARAATLIGHENIVSVDDFGRLPDGAVYIAMELLEGESLHDLLSRGGPLPLSRVVEIMRQVCRGLEAAHRKGIVHRDVKPENIFLDRRGERERIKLLDFGIAKFTGGTGSQPSLTQNGAVFGTPRTMSPEQAMGKPLDARSDLYSCGVILYQMLTGSVPFSAESFVAVLMKHVNDPVEPPRSRAPGRDIPPAVEEVVLRALAKDPADRQQSMAELERELEQAVSGAGGVTAAVGYRRRGRANRLGLPLRLGAVALVSAGVGWVVLQRVPWPRSQPAAAGATAASGASVQVDASRAAASLFRTVLVDSAPDGAEILLGGRRLDETPANVTVPSGGATEIVLRKPGWKDLTWTIAPGGPPKVLLSMQPAGQQPPRPTPVAPQRSRPPKPRPHGAGDVLVDPYR